MIRHITHSLPPSHIPPLPTHTPTYMYTYTLSHMYITAQSQKIFLPHETEQFVRLFRFGLVALDIYRVTSLPNSAYILRNSKCVQSQ